MDKHTQDFYAFLVHLADAIEHDEITPEDAVNKTVSLSVALHHARQIEAMKGARDAITERLQDRELIKRANKNVGE